LTLSSEECRLTNFIELIGDEGGSQALASALIETESGWRLRAKSWRLCNGAGRRCFRLRPWSGLRSD
jgi:hypothetical protein